MEVDLIEKFRGVWVQFGQGENLSVVGLYILSHLVCKQCSKVVKPIYLFQKRKQAQRGSGELEFNPGLPVLQFPKFSCFPASRSHGAPSFWNTLPSLVYLVNCWLPLSSRLWHYSLPAPVFSTVLCISPFIVCTAFCVCLLWTTGRKELCLIHCFSLSI